MHDYPRERYGITISNRNPRGTKYDSTRCAYEVWECYGYSHQCRNSRGHGDRALFCKVHARKYPATSESKP